jgi:hypothetical protein
VCQARKEGVGDIGSQKEEVQTTNKVRVRERLIPSTEDTHHLDQCRELGKAWLVPQEFN